MNDIDDKEPAGQDDNNSAAETRSEPQRAVTFLSIVGSVFSSFVGLQNNANRKRDFESGKFWHFFVAGLIFVIVFLLLVWGAVKYLMATTPTG